MFHNYFFLKRLAKVLDIKLTGSVVSACFSQNKDELILVFNKKSVPFIIRANLDPSISLLQFLQDFSRAGKNTVDLFPELLEQVVANVQHFDYERSFQINFQNGNGLIFKMHARRANILLSKDDEVIKLFRKNLVQDHDIIPSSLPKLITLTKDNFEAHQNDLFDWIPALGKESKIYLEQTDFTNLNNEGKWRVFNKLLELLDNNPIYLIDSEQAPRISLLEHAGESASDPIIACNWLYDKSTRYIFFEKEKQQLINQLNQTIKKTENYIDTTSQKLSKLEQSRNPEEIANILMANLHQLQTGLSQAVLTDLYTNNPITISLNTKLTPQKNAETYYRRSKNRNKELASLKRNIQLKRELLEKSYQSLMMLIEINSSKELRNFKKAHGFEKFVEKKEVTLPYHLFEEDGWIIMVGKNSK